MQLCPQAQVSQDKSTRRRRHQGVSLPWLMGHTQGCFVQLDGGHGSSPRGVRFLDTSGIIRPAAIYLYNSSFMLHFALVPSPNKTFPSPQVHMGPSGAFVASWNHLQLCSTRSSVQSLYQRLQHSAPKQHFSPPQITPQSSPDRHPRSQNRDPVPPGRHLPWERVPVTNW